MVYATCTGMAGSIDAWLVCMAGAIPALIPMILLFFWIAITAGLYFGTRRSFQQVDFFAAGLVGSIFVSAMATMMTLRDGLITIYTLTPVAVITIFFIVAFLFSRER